MTKPVLLVCIAVMCYALQNNILEQKLTDKFNPAVIILVAYLTMLPLAFVRFGQLRLMGTTVKFPTEAMLLLALFAGLLWFLGDYLYVSAFAAGGDLITITMIITMYPVAASVIKFIWVGGLPNRYQVIAYGFAVIAVYFASKGSVVAAH